MGKRLVQLYLGLVLYGFSASLLVLSGLGLSPWDVLHQGLAKHSSLAIGTWSILVGLFVLLLWIPLRERPGIGTVSNVIFIGGTMDVVLAHLSPPHELSLRIVCLVVGVFLNGVATGAYIGAGLGPGPRDGLMTGLAKRGRSIRIVRTSLEISVVNAYTAVLGYGTLPADRATTLRGFNEHHTTRAQFFEKLTADTTKVTAAQLATVADEILSVAGLLRAQPRLRRALTDPARSGDNRAELLKGQELGHHRGR